MPGNKFLILTLNPSSSNYAPTYTQRQEVAIYSETPWARTGINDFFTEESSAYEITPYIRTSFYELARLEGNCGHNVEQIKEIAFNYAKTECPIASFVPFRTRKGEKITPEMYKFAEEVLWPEIFNIWLPQAIIVFSKEAYTSLKRVFRETLTPLRGKEKRIKMDSCSFYYESSPYSKNDFKITLVGFPHPTGSHGVGSHDRTKYTGIPEDFEKHCGENGTPFRQFLEKTLLNK